MLGCKLPDYKVNRAEALRYLGYAGQALDAEMEARIDKNIAACECEARPGFVFRSFPIETCERGVRLAGSSLVLEGADIARHLKGAAESAERARCGHLRCGGKFARGKRGRCVRGGRGCRCREARHAHELAL